MPGKIITSTKIEQGVEKKYFCKVGNKALGINTQEEPTQQGSELQVEQFNNVKKVGNKLEVE